MNKVVLDISMSLDGYVTADRRTPDEPLGSGGEALHDWLLNGGADDHAMLAEAGAGTGAVITGRRNYDDSIRWWGADGPTGDARLPVYVVSHGQPERSPEVPVLFGGGLRLFEHLGDEHVRLETVASTQTAAATHLRFKLA